MGNGDVRLHCNRILLSYTPLLIVLIMIHGKSVENADELANTILLYRCNYCVAVSTTYGLSGHLLTGKFQ